jgi:hypothetical protein
MPVSNPASGEAGFDWWRQVIESCYRERSDSRLGVCCDWSSVGIPWVKLAAVRAELGLWFETVEIEGSSAPGIPA